MEEVRQGSSVGANTERKLPYAIWNVNGKEYKLKLTTEAICNLEERFKKNLLLVIGEDGLPALSTMVLIIQQALSAYHHGFGKREVTELFDEYFDHGGTQTELLSDVLMPLMTVSGFFTKEQMEEMTEETVEL